MNNTKIFQECDLPIVDHIISYLPITNKMFINKKLYIESQQICKNKIITIENFYLKHKLRLEMLFEYFDEENIQAIRNYYIIFYPKKYRKSLFEQIIKYRAHNLDNSKYYTIVKYIELSKHLNNYNIYFSKFMNLLTLDDIAFMGW